MCVLHFTTAPKQQLCRFHFHSIPFPWYYHHVQPSFFLPFPASCIHLLACLVFSCPGVVYAPVHAFNDSSHFPIPPCFILLHNIYTRPMRVASLFSHPSSSRPTFLQSVTLPNRKLHQAEEQRQLSSEPSHYSMSCPPHVWPGSLFSPRFCTMWLSGLTFGSDKMIQLLILFR